MTEEYKKRKAAYIAAYQKKIYKNFSFKLRIVDDEPIIRHLMSRGDRSSYIKSLIKKDMGE